MDVVAVVSRVAAIDVSSADRVVVEQVLSDVATTRRWLDGVEVACARRLDALAHTTPSMFPEQLTATATRQSLRHGANVHERATTAGTIAELGSALADGEVSGAHVDAVTAAMKGLKPEHRAELASRGKRLALLAATTTPDEFRKVVTAEVRSIEADDGLARLERQKRAVRLRAWTDRDTGMVRLSGSFDPETGMKLLSRLEQQLEALFHGPTPEGCPTDPMEKQDFLRAHALLDLIAGKGSLCGRPEFVVTIDLQTFRNGRHPGSRVDCGTDIDLPIPTIRDLAKNARFHPVVIDDDGAVVTMCPPVDSIDDLISTLVNGCDIPLDLGRSNRLASRNQRRAIRAMYRHCVVPNCRTHVSRTEPHHCVHWEDGGPTDLANLVPLCKHHHDIAHAQGWTFRLGTDRSLTIRFPDGNIMTTGPPAEQWR